MERLFIYGSLQPGGPNAQVLAAVAGNWQPAAVKGRLIEAGWGASLGFPGLVLDEDGGDVHGQVFTSTELAAMWADLDQFEGDEYERVIASVSLMSGERVDAYIYVLRI